MTIMWKHNPRITDKWRIICKCFACAKEPTNWSFIDLGEAAGNCGDFKSFRGKCELSIKCLWPMKRSYFRPVTCRKSNFHSKALLIRFWLQHLRLPWPPNVSLWNIKRPVVRISRINGKRMETGTVNRTIRFWACSFHFSLSTGPFCTSRTYSLTKISAMNLIVADSTHHVVVGGVLRRTRNIQGKLLAMERTHQTTEEKV